MFERDSRRARPPRRARYRKFTIAVARSSLLETMLRSAAIFVILLGLLFTAWGMLSGVGMFAADLSTLVKFAGGGDVVAASTVDVFRVQVLRALGLAPPPLPEEEIAQVPQTGPVYTSATPAPGEGFVPYQVEVGAAAGEDALDVPEALLAQEAPPLPDAGPAPPTPDASLPTPTPAPPAIPGWIVIPRIELDAPITVSHTKMIRVGGKVFAQWEAPNAYAAGWQEASALLGEPGNTVLNGHHNVFGKVFGRLIELKPYDEILVYSGDREFRYLVSQVMKVEERDASLEQRQENARWIMHASDERLTLVTCWPPTSNAYRLIVVAVPVK